MTLTVLLGKVSHRRREAKSLPKVTSLASGTRNQTLTVFPRALTTSDPHLNHQHAGGRRERGEIASLAPFNFDWRRDSGWEAVTTASAGQGEGEQVVERRDA